MFLLEFPGNSNADHQLVNRFSAILTILIVTVLLLDMFCLRVWRSHVALSQEKMARERALEQQLRSMQESSELR
jgi:hypothetical protein